MRTPTLTLKKNLRPKFFFSSFLAVFVGNSVTPISTLANNKRSRSKKGEISGQNCVFSVFSLGEKFGRSRISRTSGAPSRLFRPRPIDCARESEHTVKIFPRLFGQFFFEHRQKIRFFKRVLHLVLIYTPKEAHGRIS